MAVTCANGHSNLDGMAFCEECGVELTALTDRPAIVDPEVTGSAPTSPGGVDPDVSGVVPGTQPAGGEGATPTMPTSPATPTPSPGATAGQTLAPGDLPPGSAGPSQDQSAPAAALVPGHAYLEVSSGSFAGRRFPVAEPICTIGRWDMDSGAFPEIDLTEVDEDAKVSRKHVRISKENDQYVVEDLGSLNGTSLNRAPRLLPGDRQVLHSNDELIIGRLFLKFVVG